MYVKIRLILCAAVALFFIITPGTSGSWIIQSVSQEIAHKDGSSGMQSSIQVAGGLEDGLFMVQQTEQVNGKNNPDQTDLFVIPLGDAVTAEGNFTADVFNILKGIKRRDGVSSLDLCTINSIISESLPEEINNTDESDLQKIIHENSSQDIIVQVSEILSSQLYDFGDAPDGMFHTLSVSNGARHRIVPGFYLGESIDQEGDGSPNSKAKGDDLVGEDDEDGIVFPGVIAPGSEVNITVKASLAGFLNAWMDFDCDGDWDGDREMIFSGLQLNRGLNHLSFDVPSDLPSGQQLCSRFRLSREKSLPSDGEAPDGEVEDYCISSVEF